MSNVVPLRRPKPPEPQPERCPDCGWKMPVAIKAYRDSVGPEILLYVDCPECEAKLVLLVRFE